MYVAFWLVLIKSLQNLRQCDDNGLLLQKVQIILLPKDE